MTQDTETKNVHQGITLKAFIEINLAADGRDADTVTVMRDAGDDAGEEPSVSGDVCCLLFAVRLLRNWPEAQRVEAEFRTRAHREDIANDSPNASGRALERLDGARVVVALDLERNRPAIADIDHAGVLLAGFHENVWPGGGKFLQFFF